jgi:hypothetical protein
VPSSADRAEFPGPPGPGAPAARPPEPVQAAPPTAGQAPPGPAVPAPDGANWPATAALACGILGGALITIPAGLMLAAVGFHRTRQGSRGRVRCWAAVILSLAWAGAAGYLVPHLIRAADPGCVAYKNTALTAYNRMAADVSNGVNRARLAQDLAAAIATVGEARSDTRSAAASRPLAALSGELRTMRADVRAGRVVPRQLLLSLNRETRAADAACGTVHL